MIRVSRNWGLWSLALVLAAGLSLSACGKKEESAEKPPAGSSTSDQMKNAAQPAGESMKETGEKAGAETPSESGMSDQMKNAAQKAGEAMKNAGEKAGEATEKAGDAMKDESKPEESPSE